ncbi:MAG: ribosome-associated translation inhibitor RaiA [Tannerella sp.]|jgi:putative sigma-54 modulation protein|nr:ribosome-associated translation inhibitor RaiA [Tannerella sp.]
MDIKIKSIHFDATEKLEAFIEKKVSKLEHLYEGIIMADVALKVVKPETVKNKSAGIRIKIKNGDCFAEKICDTFEEAVDTAVEALEKQLLKYKEKSKAK